MSKVPQAYLDARADEIRTAALAVFVRKGVELATMQDIASEAGVSPGAIYRYFSSKEELVQAVFALCHEQNRELFESALAGDGSARAALFSLGRAVWDGFHGPLAIQTYTLNVEAALSAARHPDEALAAQVRGLHAGVVAHLSALARAAQANRELPADLDPAAFALTIAACVEGLRLLFVQAAGQLDTEGVYDVLGRMVGALAPAAEGG